MTHEPNGDQAGAGERGPATHRVFLALWPDEAASTALFALGQNLARELGGRATPRDRLHLTVAFVPAASAEEVATLRAIGAEAATATGVFEVAIDHLGTFRDSGVVWAASAALPVALASLADHVRTALAQSALPVDRRPYRPHFTLVRRAPGMLRQRIIEPVSCAFDALTLIESELGNAGPRYTVLERWPFAARIP